MPPTDKTPTPSEQAESTHEEVRLSPPDLVHSEAYPPEIAELINASVTQAVKRVIEEVQRMLAASQDKPYTSLLTIGEVADWLNVSERKVYDLSRKGELVPMKIDGSARYSVESVQAYLRSRANAKRSCARRRRAA